MSRLAVKRLIGLLFVIAGQALLLQSSPAFAQPVPAIEPTTTLASSEDLLAEGRRIYERRCSVCHGATGSGDGTAAYLLYPKPRNFRRGPFRFVSTWEGVPTDQDLYRIISRGIPGSAMPPWAHLSERQRWGLVHFVKTLSEEPIEIRPSVEPDFEEGEDGEGVITVPPEPPLTAASIARGAELFAIGCASCHGDRGRGDGEAAGTLFDDDGIAIRPRDLATGVIKGSPGPEHLYRRIVLGIPGTPMPSSPSFVGEDGWHLVHFVLSLSSERLRERAEMRRYRISARRVAAIPDHPDAGEWRQVPSVELHLMPLWWRYNRPEYLSVQAVHDGKEIALLLLWGDETDDDLVIRPQDFRDAAAIQFAEPGSEPPLFAMGEKGHFVNIWMWKAERQADIRGFHDLEAQYPLIGIDSYPNLQLLPYEQPTRNALTLESDPNFITAWGAGNVVSDPTRKSAAEDLVAQGFGTLRARGRALQNVHAQGTHAYGSYRVLFRRSLEGEGRDAVSLSPGGVVPVAFAIWNGSAGDRDGKKSVTIWQELVIQP